MPKLTSEAKLLMSRICNGYTWLKTNENNPHYADGLKQYEELVDEARKLGIEEKDCWPVPVEEAIEIFTGPKPEQSQLVA